MSGGGAPLEELRAEARYRRTRLALYKARLYARPSSSSAKLRELERASQGADERLLRAERSRIGADAPEAGAEDS